ncbi:MAG: hypothetical protein WC717_00610 [Candidatus Micrarchaeia archaeon]|jgi:hypothetical protein
MEGQEEYGIQEIAPGGARKKPIDLRADGEDSPRADSDAMIDIVEQARHVQRVAEKIYFLSVLKRFGLAFGGILLLLGTLGATAFFLLFFGVFSTGLPANIELLVEVGLAMIAIIHILAGLALLAG